VDGTLSTQDATMTRWDRLLSATNSAPVDRVPVMFWQKYSGEEIHARACARSHLDFFRTYDQDVLKVTPPDALFVQGWGAQVERRADKPAVVTAHPVHHPADWHNLPVLDVERADMGIQLETIRLLHAELGDEAPVLATVPSPFYLAWQLVGERDRLITHVQKYSDALRDGLETLTLTLGRYARACLAAGAAGVFYVAGGATTDLLSENEYKAFALGYDLRILSSLVQSRFNVLHIPGRNIMFDLLATYPVSAISWYDRGTGPTLREAQTRLQERKITGKALAGGLDHRNVLLTGTADDVLNQVVDALDQTGGRGFILAPGDALDPGTPADNLRMARDSVQP